LSVETRQEARELKGRQPEAAYALDRHVSVTAGPGAGKTFVLVERYLEILRQHPQITVDQIVAITFTNRAANEMRTRLRAELDRLMRAASSTERARWLRHKRTLDGAVITTIHGFCSRLLRQFPIEAGVDPQFELLDEHQTAMLEESVSEEVLTEFINAGDQVMSNLTVTATRSGLSLALIEMYREARNQGLSLADLATRTQATHARTESPSVSIQELEELMTEFLGMRRLTPAAAQQQADCARRWPALLDLLKRLVSDPASVEAVLPELLPRVRSFRECRPNRSDRLSEIVSRLDELICEKDLGGRVVRDLLDPIAQRYSSEVISALVRLEERLALEKRRIGALDFDDLQIKTLRLLESSPEATRRASSSYRFFLVDEFQDTNSLQQSLLERLAISGVAGARRVNLFIVGDRKQSVYGFRGADVDVFREMTATIEREGGKPVALDLNFRSQRPLVEFFNYLFQRLFRPDDSLPATDLNQLGYVEYDRGQAERPAEQDEAPIEFLIDVRKDERLLETTPSERDAAQLALRIPELLDRFEYRNIALLFRAMTEVHVYEAALRRANIPYLTVQGKGFYAREEITDLIQLLRFLDNRTDEIALAAVLRSPLCGLSDDALYALRCAPTIDVVRERGRMLRRRGVRPLLFALRHQSRIDFISDEERVAADRARDLLDNALSLRNRVGLADLLRFIVERSEYRPVIASSFDGAARLANLEKLFTLAERFEKSGAYLIRDFVRFVSDFEESGGRESEGQLYESANVVRLMTIHQSKGLEFRVVIIPELHRLPETQREWYVLDRHRGLSVQVPDGRGGRVKGATFVELRRRAKLRENFESMRLLYVAATRARDLLLLSGATQKLESIRQDSWLGRIWRELGLEAESFSDGCFETRVVHLDDSVDLRISINSVDASRGLASSGSGSTGSSRPEARLTPSTAGVVEWPEKPDEAFPLLDAIDADRESAIHRFSVTQLVNFQRCARQYFFERVLHTPTGEEIGWWNDAEKAEPPANLTATLRGAVIHRFCEKYEQGADIGACLSSSFEEILRQREAQLGDRVAEIDRNRATADLMPLAQNYLESGVRKRIERARSGPGLTVCSLADLDVKGSGGGVVFSEQRFRLRRPVGILTGAVDKLLISRASDGSLEAEIIDFKTNRFRRDKSRELGAVSGSRRRSRSAANQNQLALEFPEQETDAGLLVRAEVENAALDYRLQMQAYALAVRELLPVVVRVKVTLHFLEPNVEVSVDESLLEREVCASAIDDAVRVMVRSADPLGFAVRVGEHCRSCSFMEFCEPGRSWLRNLKSQISNFKSETPRV